MNYRNIINKGTTILKKNAILTANIDAEWLLSIAINKTREKILLNLEDELSLKEESLYLDLVNRRKIKEPISYIRGKKFFWKYDFVVNKNVLTPRFETELLIEEVLKLYKNTDNIRVLDIGLGSGCILISLLKEKKRWKGVGIDVSELAINVAKTNAKIQQVRNRIKFINSDIDKFNSYKYDLIVSNPPYIKKSKLSSLIEDVKNFEPKLALDGGPDGYSAILKVIAKSSKLLKKNGMLFIEIDNTQVIKTKEMLKKYKFFTKDVCKDLSGNNRCITAIKL
mgnify:CR=1 FL=1